MKKSLNLISLVVVTLFLYSFYQVEDSVKADSIKSAQPWPPLVQKQYDAKIKNFIDTRRARCLEDILKDAETFVDSTIISEINIKLLDTLVFPDRPPRPQYPDQIVLDDSTNLAPIIK